MLLPLFLLVDDILERLLAHVPHQSLPGPINLLLAEILINLFLQVELHIPYCVLDQCRIRLDVVVTVLQGC